MVNLIMLLINSHTFLRPSHAPPTQFHFYFHSTVKTIFRNQFSIKLSTVAISVADFIFFLIRFSLILLAFFFCLISEIQKNNDEFIGVISFQCFMS